MTGAISSLRRSSFYDDLRRNSSAVSFHAGVNLQAALAKRSYYLSTLRSSMPHAQIANIRITISGNMVSN